MARRRSYRLETAEDPVLDISSLIDVSFLLLIYFLVTSTLQKKETDLSFTLPSNIASEESTPVDPQTIRVEADGSVLLEKEPIEPASDPTVSVNLPTLFERMKVYKDTADAAGSTPVVILDAVDDGKTQRFVDVVNTLGKLKISNLTMTGFRDE